MQGIREEIQAIAGNAPWTEPRFGDGPSRDAYVAWVDGPDARYGFDASTEQRALEGLLALVKADIHTTQTKAA